MAPFFFSLDASEVVLTLLPEPSFSPEKSDVDNYKSRVRSIGGYKDKLSDVHYTLHTVYMHTIDVQTHGQT